TTQIIQTREIDVFKPLVIIFTRVEGGTASNVIPTTVKLGGSIRYLCEDGEGDEKKFERVIAGVCKAHRAKYELKFIHSNRMLSNDPGMAELVRITAEKIVRSQDDIASDVRTMAGEDFAEFALRVPCAFG
ncbi:unnamed protein product, partial [marine sediment metagenome]